MTYFQNYLKQFGDKEINIYVDMDGVVADYDMLSYETNKSNSDVYLNKRPIKTIINVLEELSHIENVNIYILSVARLRNQIDGKLKWLKENMSFITPDHINIIPRDENDFKHAPTLKRDFLKNNIDINSINIMIDDSHQVLDVLYSSGINVIPLHITSIID